MMIKEARDSLDYLINLCDRLKKSTVITQTYYLYVDDLVKELSDVIIDLLQKEEKIHVSKRNIRLL